MNNPFINDRYTQSEKEKVEKYLSDFDTIYPDQFFFMCMCHKTNIELTRLRFIVGDLLKEYLKEIEHE